MSSTVKWWAGMLLVACTIGGAAPAAADTNAQQRLAACDDFMEAYARSASRKLGRALDGQDYRTDELPADAQLQVQLAGEAHTFEFFFEKDRRVAGVADRERAHRVTYIVASTQQGPVVARHRWPERDAIAAGRAECKPISSRVDMPVVPVADIDVEPFKFWGLRVVWHIPSEPHGESTDLDALTALRQVIGNSSEASADASSD